MSFPQACLLFLAAVVGGTLNSVAGGGSFFTFPALLFTGVLPINANATSTVALWPGSVASAGAYRAELGGQRQRLLELGGVSIVGGTLGAIVLLRTSQSLFLHLVPYLLLLATLVFAFGGQLTQAFRARLSRAQRTTAVEAKSVEAKSEQPEQSPSRLALAGTVLVQFIVALYGGFFGGGMGIMMLALLAFMGMTNIHAMNAVKTILTACINGMAVIAFVVAGAVVWPQAILMIAGAVIGGYGGAAVAQRIDPLLVRRAVIVIGFGLSAYFFVKG